MENKILIEKLKILELENTKSFDIAKIKQLENFYYKALDKTKDIKFIQKVNQGMPESKNQSKTEELWKVLEIPMQTFVMDSDSEDSELEFESSFYKSKRINEMSVDLNESSRLK